jgi:hypothetical protein
MKILRNILCTLGIIAALAAVTSTSASAQTTVMTDTGILTSGSTPLTGFITFQTNDCHSHAVTLVSGGTTRYSGATFLVTAGAYSGSIQTPSFYGGGFCYQVGVYDAVAGTMRFLTGQGAFAPTTSTASIMTATTTATAPDASVPAALTSVGGGSIGSTQVVSVNGVQCPVGGSCTIATGTASVMGASGVSHAAGSAPDPGATAGTTRYLREDGTWTTPPSTGGATSFAGLSGVAQPSQLPPLIASGAGHSAGIAPDPGATAGTTRYLREDGTWTPPPGTGGASFPSGTGIVKVTGGTPGLAAAGTDYDAAGAAAAAQAYFTGKTGYLSCNGSACVGVPNATPAPDVKPYPAAVCDGGSAFASGVTRYDNQEPQAGCVSPATSTRAYLIFNPAPSLAQYAEATIAFPPYWTGTTAIIDWAAGAYNGTPAVTSGSAVWTVQYYCTALNSVPATGTFSTPLTVSSAVSTTSGGEVYTGSFTLAANGANGCPATGNTTPGTITYRVYRSLTDGMTSNAWLLGLLITTGRSQ